MDTNIYKDRMQKAYLFGTAVLYSPQPIPREDVPQYWFGYDLRGTDRQPDKPYALVDKTEQNFAGSILSPLPLKKGAAQSRLVKDKLELTAEYIRLADFCSEYHIQTPQTPIRHTLRPASPDEAGLFYALEPEEDEKLGTIGHIRIDFGHRGQEFWHSWWPRGPEELNSPEFKAELGQVVDELRLGVLKDLPSMRRYCREAGGEISGQNYGFVVETERYRYCLRCNPVEGDYQAYLTAFDKQAQKHEMGLTEKGRQALQDTADPAREHTYSWYVIEHINDPDKRVDHTLPLDEAIRLYAELNSTDKRLGVVKDSIASVDLAIRWDGREWISEDWLKSDSFAQDQVVAEAVGQIRQALEEPSQGQGMEDYSMADYLSRDGHDPEFALTLATPFSADRISLPASESELEQLKETLNTDCLDDAVISDVVVEYPWANLLPMDGITLDNANLLAQFVGQMSENELRTFGAALEAEEPATFADAACIAENIGDYELVDVTEGAYGREALRKAGTADEVFEMLDGFLDYERLGQAMMESDGVRPTSYGLIRCPGSSGHQQEMGQTMY